MVTPRLAAALPYREAARKIVVAARDAAGLSMNDLSRLCGVNRTAPQQWCGDAARSPAPLYAAIACGPEFCREVGARLLALHASTDRIDSAPSGALVIAIGALAGRGRVLAEESAELRALAVRVMHVCASVIALCDKADEQRMVKL